MVISKSKYSMLKKVLSINNPGGYFFGADSEKRITFLKVKVCIIWVDFFSWQTLKKVCLY